VTFILSVTCPSGVALSADSRLCAEVPDPSAPGGHRLERFTDSARKMTVLGDRYLLAIGGRLPGGTPDHVLDAVAADAAVASSLGDVDATQAAVLAAVNTTAGAGTTKTARLMFAYVDDIGRPRVLYTDADGNWQPYNVDDRGRPAYAVCHFTVADVVIERLITPRMPLFNFSLRQAVDLSRWAIQTEIDVAEFEARPSQIGPPILTAVVTRDGARWITPPPPIEARDFGLAVAAP
jgi:hypothetical protein